MNGRIISVAFAAFLCLLTGMATANPTVEADGNLSDWGIVPFTDMTPDIPVAAASIENWHDDNYPYGGETFDQEAIFLHIEGHTIDVAIITSFPAGGVDDPYGRPIHYTAGDIAIDFFSDAFEYEIGIKTTGPGAGQVFYKPNWSLPHAAYGFPANGPSTLDGGTFIGMADLAYVNAGDLEGNGTDTWIIEMSWNVSSPLWAEMLDGIMVHNVMSCGNDSLDVCTQNVPEPATMVMLLVGAGVMGVKRIVRRRIAK